MDIDPGTVVANRYRIIRPLGRGGMGEVFAAENIRTGRPVAVKLLRSDSKSKASAMARFRQEARAAGSINSDHVTQVLDVEDDHEHGVVLVFELLEGESLIDRLKRTGPIPFEELHPIIEQVWMGLSDAHRVGIIHRDLKPSNVFLERRPDGTTRVKILDFGISKLPKEMGGETLTEMGQSLGTFSFMPPEQIGKAKTVDHRADIYACATLIYQSLTGQLPYSARNILVMVEMKSKTDARRLAEAMGGPVDPRLEAFIAQGLERDPSKRFQTAVEALNMWRELRPTQWTGSLDPSVSQQAPLPMARLMTPPQRPAVKEPRGMTPPQRPGAADASRTHSFGSPVPAASAGGPSAMGSLPAGASLGGPASSGSPHAASLRGMTPPQRSKLPSALPASGSPSEPPPPGRVLLTEPTTDSAATLARPLPINLRAPVAADGPAREGPIGARAASTQLGYDAKGVGSMSTGPVGLGGTQPVRLLRPVSPTAQANANKPSNPPPPRNPATASDRPPPEQGVAQPDEPNTFDESQGGQLAHHPAGYFIPPAVAATLRGAHEGMPQRSPTQNNPAVTASLQGPVATQTATQTGNAALTSTSGQTTPPSGQPAVPRVFDEPSSTPGNSIEFATQVFRPTATGNTPQVRAEAAAPTQPQAPSSPWAFLLGAIAFLLVGFVIVAAIMHWM